MAVIGIDLTPLQTGHKMRGIGSTALNIMINIPQEDKKRHTFIVFLYPRDVSDILRSIDSTSFDNLIIRQIEEYPAAYPPLKSLDGIKAIPRRYKDYRDSRRLGTRRITDTDDIDVFLQFEQDVIPPRSVKTITIAYDLIPYILEPDYLWNYSTARHAYHYSRRGAVLCQLRRNAYLGNIRTVMKRSSKILAISKQTRHDFIKYTKVSDQKISLCYLGVSPKATASPTKPHHVIRYTGTQWGDIQSKESLPTNQFLLFVGGLDARRRINTLVGAFNQLRARGYPLNLVLAGDTMNGPNSVPNQIVKESLINSSYLDDIYMLGYVDDTTRDWLYKNALAFVYPTKYEGFGLPVLEALRYGTHVITSQNSSLIEITDASVDFIDSSERICEKVIELLTIKGTDEADQREKRKESAEKFTWASTSTTVMLEIKKLL
ncbi:glycosyltransferase family 4 protein [Candidatus Saccharibacteria bacterium]|nr:glycosyltransferase family 4 protein [Candidatus Saccharibacteria bacterium]